MGKSRRQQKANRGQQVTHSRCQNSRKFDSSKADAMASDISALLTIVKKKKKRNKNGADHKEGSEPRSQQNNTLIFPLPVFKKFKNQIAEVRTGLQVATPHFTQSLVTSTWQFSKGRPLEPKIER